MTASRRINDFYPTPAWATETLLDRVPVNGVIFEPCAGDGRIASVLKNAQGFKDSEVYTNDLDPAFDCDYHGNALQPEAWQWVAKQCGGSIDWVVSNPPFSLADRLVPIAVDQAYWGCAMLLRLSWLEPTKSRAEFLAQHPPTQLIVLPRISFDGSGSTDSVTCAWFVWDKGFSGQRLSIVPRRAKQEILL